MSTENVIYVPTDKIQKIALLAEFDINNPYSVEDGDWDITEIMNYSDSSIYRSLKDMILDGKKWQDTILYKGLIKDMNSGNPKWGCDTVEKCIERGNYLMNLYDDIKRIGKILNREDLLKVKGLKSKSYFGENDCIQVAIGRNGQILFASNGAHRLSIAKILGIKTIPAVVCKRHIEWVKYRDTVLAICKKRWDGKTYQKMYHPDLQFVEIMHQDTRYDTLKANTELSGVKLLDIGSLFGYVCFRGDIDGYRCTAVEIVGDFINVMEKMRNALDMNFDIAKTSVFDLEDKNHDIVVAFNIFHHFIKTEELHTKLIKLLGELKYTEMFVQFHKQSEKQMERSYKNYSEDEFAKFIIQHSKNKTSYKCVGNHNGRKIYKIY